MGKKNFEKYIDSLTEKELIDLLKKHNITYPIELSTIDKILKNTKPVKLTEETKKHFLETMRKTARKLWGKKNEY